MYLCVRGIDFASFYDFCCLILELFDSVVFLLFILSNIIYVYPLTITEVACQIQVYDTTFVYHDTVMLKELCDVARDHIN